MEKFILKIKKRMVYQMVGAILLIPAAVYAFIKYLGTDGFISGTPLKDFIGGMFNGIRSATVAGFVIYLLVMFFFNLKLLKNEKERKEAFIVQNDEREIAISEASSKMTFHIALYAILAACLISGLFNSIISITLLATWVFLVVVRTISTYVFERKM